MKTEAHLINYVNHTDIRLAMGRIPEFYRKRVRHIFIENGCRGVRQLGCVKAKERRDIFIYSWLPPRVSLKRFLYRGQSAAEFGAPGVGQWTPWAVRRFLLYDVVLHELGHLQEIYPGKKNWRRRFAAEPKAEEFADYWRRTLFSEDKFHYPDLVHHAPSKDEMAFLEVWALLDKRQRYLLTELALSSRYRREMPDLSFIGKLPEKYERFLRSSLVQNPTAEPYLT